MGNPIPIQERSVDPYSSYDSNVVNKLTRMISDGKNVLLLPSAPYAIKQANAILNIIPGKVIMDDVLIETTEEHLMNTNDVDNYLDTSGGIWNEDGYYYLIMSYEYEKTSPPPSAAYYLIKPSQRATVYDPEKHLMVNVLEVTVINSVRRISNIYGFDPDNVDVKRDYASGGGGSSGTSTTARQIDGPGTFTITPDDDVLAIDTTNGVVNLILPIVTTTDKIVRIVKMTPSAADNTAVNIMQGQVADTIEGEASISLLKKWDSVTLMPLQSNDWVQL